MDVPVSVSLSSSALPEIAGEIPALRTEAVTVLADEGSVETGRELVLQRGASDSEGTTLSCGSSEDVQATKSMQGEDLKRHKLLRKRLSEAKYKVRRCNHVLEKKEAAKQPRMKEKFLGTLNENQVFIQWVERVLQKG